MGWGLGARRRGELCWTAEGVGAALVSRQEEPGGVPLPSAYGQLNEIVDLPLPIPIRRNSAKKGDAIAITARGAEKSSVIQVLMRT